MTVPNVARVYDYLLGGKDNFEADREAGEKIKSLIPNAEAVCRENRYFLERVVRYLVGRAGIRQIIDIGTGLPTQANVHEVAQQIHPSTRVVYVDNDLIVVRYAQALLATNERVDVVCADLRRPADILDAPEVKKLIDFRQPVAVTMLATLHFVADSEQPHKIVRQYTDALVPGSYFALSHVTADDTPTGAADAAQAVYKEASANVTPRSHGELLSLFDGIEWVPPGLVDINDWLVPKPPYAAVTRRSLYGGIGRTR